MEKKARTFKLGLDLDNKMIEYAKIHCRGNITSVIVMAVERFLHEEAEKTERLPEELINGILFSTNLLLNGQKDEATWDLLLKEAQRECQIINHK